MPTDIDEFNGLLQEYDQLKLRMFRVIKNKGGMIARYLRKDYFPYKENYETSPLGITKDGGVFVYKKRYLFDDKIIDKVSTYQEMRQYYTDREIRTFFEFVVLWFNKRLKSLKEIVSELRKL